MVPDHDAVDIFLEKCPIYGKGYWFTVAMRQEEYVLYTVRGVRVAATKKSGIPNIVEAR